MEYENCWTFPLDTEITTDSAANVAEIMEEQAAYLEKETGGKVKAAFSYANIVCQKERVATTDISSAYSGTDYALVMYNGRYFFKILTVRIGAFYPVVITPDKDLLDEARNTLPKGAKTERVHLGDSIETGISVKSDAEFMGVISCLFATRKVKWMIWKLRQMEGKEG